VVVGFVAAVGAAAGDAGALHAASMLTIAIQAHADLNPHLKIIV
jgi:hypothetical protein